MRRALLIGLCSLVPALAFAGGGASLPETQAFEKALKKKMPAAKASPSAPASAGGYSDGNAAGQLGTSQMRAANRLASEILERRMREQRGNELKLIREAGAAEVVVVSGGYDRVQDVLRAVQVKHVVIPPHLVEHIPLMSTQTLMVNCPGNLTKAGIAKVRHFVKTGGYLVTTDWALTLLAAAFPGYVARGGRNTGNDVVAVHMHSSDDPTLKQVKAVAHAPRWWLESSSYPIRIVDKQKVKVLISSEEMRKKYGHSPIAVTFRFDDGKVLHMTSHFYLQQSKLLAKQERAEGTAFAKAAGLSAKEVAALKAKGLDKVRSGELNSAYSMQQVTANVLVSKQADNKALLGKFGKRARRAITLQTSGDKDAKPKTDGQVEAEYRLRVMKTKKGKALVRDLFGREGWVDEADLK